jgi:hypothetical protein
LEVRRVAADRETLSEAEEQGAWGRPVPAVLGEVLMAVALLAVAAFFIWQAALLPFGTVGLPGPGFFPFALGIALGFFMLIILYRTLRAPEEAGPIYIGHRNVLAVLAALVAMAAAFETADTYLLLGAFAAALLLLVARAAAWRALLGASLGMVAVWAVFNVALGVRLPASDTWREIAAAILPPGLF